MAKCPCCGRYFGSPEPRFCSRCKTPIPNGSIAGDRFQVITEHPKKIKTYKNDPDVLEILCENGITVMFLRKEEGEDRDTGNLPIVKK